MTERTLFIHAGGKKTGSSAIQNFLEINASKLENYGFTYAHNLNINSEYDVNSGNGVLLYNALSFTSISANEIDNLVLSYFEKSNNAICSSECFGDLDDHNWRKLFESSVRIGIKLQVIFYIRNIIPFVLSAYDQVIKLQGEFRLFNNWTLEAAHLHVIAPKSLRIMLNVLPLSNISVLHYDQEKGDLISGFLNYLGIPPFFLCAKNEHKRQVNRSLTEKERESLLLVNSSLGMQYSKELSELFICSNPNVRGELISYDKKTEEFLLDLFSNEVDWVNNTFFNGKSVVSVLPMESDIKQEPNLMLKQTQNSAVEKQVLDWALEKLKHIQNETECRILDSLNNAVSQNASKNYPPEIPVDFDALAYLLLNRDVLHAGMDAIQHYINHGKSEGRRYRF